MAKRSISGACEYQGLVMEVSGRDKGEINGIIEGISRGGNGRRGIQRRVREGKKINTSLFFFKKKEINGDQKQKGV